MDSIRGKRWVIPLVLLLVIVAASGLRWNEEASKTLEDGVLRWERDRWTRDLWVKGYYLELAGERLAVPDWTRSANERAWALRDNLTLARDILAGVTIFWLAVELLRDYRKKEKVKTGENT